MSLRPRLPNRGLLAAVATAAWLMGGSACGPSTGTLTVTESDSGGGGSDEEDDADQGGGGGDALPGGDADGSGADAPGTIGYFGDPCETDRDCASGYCLLNEDEYVCTEFCVDTECPEGWKCRTLINSGTDAVRLCVPDRDTLCSPCSEDTDCGQFGDRCLEIGDGRFCGRDCTADRTGCPTGYDCTLVSQTEEGESWQCMPLLGRCTCPPEMDGVSRDCVRANSSGICQGVEVCQADVGWSACSAPVPVAEDCDGLDNDCDNQIDETLADRSCSSVPNEIGTCTGTETCTGATGWQCNARVAAPEMCDGLDNDCNGIIDDGLCYDGNPCTHDICDTTTGACSYPAHEGPCDDATVCTSGDRCIGGMCQGTPVNCDDSNNCTSDTCNPVSGCVWTNLDGAPCETGNFCTADTCGAGVCRAGPAESCGTSNVCQTASCNPATGCVLAPRSGGVCDDDDICTVGDQCSGGACIAGRPFCEGRTCSNCSGDWSLSLGGWCIDFLGSPQCMCICF